MDPSERPLAGMTEHDLLNELDMALSRLWRRLGHEISHLVEQGLSVTQLVALRTLALRGWATVTELAEESGVTLSAITALTNKLVSARYVRRQRDKKDRRQVWICLTPTGEQVLREVEESRIRIFRRFSSRLEPPEIWQLVLLLRKLSEAPPEASSRQEGHR